MLKENRKHFQEAIAPSKYGTQGFFFTNYAGQVQRKQNKF